MGMISLMGGLSLARMMPILEVSGASFLREIDSIVAACGASERISQAQAVDVLRGMRSIIGPLEDSFTPDYFQATAAGVAIIVATEGEAAGVGEFRMRSSIGNFWDSCDDLLHSDGGYSRMEFQGIKSTLRGVEDIWQDGDSRIISASANDPIPAFVERLSLIRANYPRRRRIARVFAECAGWDIPVVK
ncbi:hypothetical protein [Streptomyces sp. NPDC093109]|uniref:hypothetical protein n=1 Tax=Streptomyces sp. NPDC093109 TaxID=3154977 RepID=UPI00344B5E99